MAFTVLTIAAFSPVSSAVAFGATVERRWVSRRDATATDDDEWW